MKLVCYFVEIKALCDGSHSLSKWDQTEKSFCAHKLQNKSKYAIKYVNFLKLISELHENALKMIIAHI